MKIVKIELPPVLPNEELVEMMRIIMPQVESGYVQGMCIATLDTHGDAAHYYFGCPKRTDLDERILLAEMQMGVVDTSLAILHANIPHSFSSGLVVDDES
jgi:hypothetical protein